MNYDNWKTTNRDDWQLGTSTDLEAAWGHEQPSKVEPELNQADWYHNVYLPNVRKALAGEYVDPVLLRGDDGETEQLTAEELSTIWWSD